MYGLDSQLLIAIGEAVQDLETEYGLHDPGVIEVKHILCQCLFAGRLLDAPEEAALFSKLQEISGAN